MKGCSLLTAVWWSIFNVLNEEASRRTLCFVELRDTLSWCKYAPFPCSPICRPFWSNELLFFFFLKIYYILFSGILRCHSGLFQCFINVLTGILLQLKRLYFTSGVCLFSFVLYHMHGFSQKHCCCYTFHAYFLSTKESLMQTAPIRPKTRNNVWVYVQIVYLQHSKRTSVFQDSIQIYK